MESIWYSNQPSKSPGRPQDFSDTCIQICLTVKALYEQTYRQVQGFLESFFRHMGLNLRVPSYSQLSRRSEKVRIPLRRYRSKGPVDIVIDATGLKVFGEGEWKVRMHGYSKRRTWKKLHLAVDPLDHEILGATLTTSKVRDSQVFGKIMRSVKGPVERVFGDSAYDTSHCYKVSNDRGIDLIVPPMKNARIQENTPVPPWLNVRDSAIKRIAELSKKVGYTEARSQWKYERDYHQRSLAETAIDLFGNSVFCPLAVSKISSGSSCTICTLRPFINFFLTRETKYRVSEEV